MRKRIRHFFFPSTIGARLFRIVLSVYLVIAFAVTMVLVVEEVLSAKDAVVHTISIYEKSVANTLGGALWNMDDEDLGFLAQGMLELPEVYGVVIRDGQTKATIIKVGWIQGAGGKTEFVSPSRKQANGSSLYWYSKLFHLEFPVRYAHELGTEELGTVTIYSSSQVVLERVWGRIALIMAGAFIKTLATWFVFLYFNRRILSEPLSAFVRAVEGVDLEHAKDSSIRLEMPGDNELTDLRDSFNSMLARLQEETEAKDQYAQNLEELKEELEKRVQERTRQLEEKNLKLELLSKTDQLTGLYNRRHLEEVLRYEIKRCERYNHALSLILLDLDYFKRVNDTYGHDVGDRVLSDVAATLRRHTRQSDVIGRWGGEEFLILAIETSKEFANSLAENLRNELQKNKHNQAGCVAGSFGVAEYQPGDDVIALIKRADMALYAAKAKGRNRVEIC